MEQKFTKYIGVGLIIIVLISGISFYLKTNNSPGKTQDKPTGTNLGQRAPGFELSNLEGEQVNLSDFRGQYVVLNFWASWCPPCRQEMPELNRFHQQKEEFVVLGVDIGEEEAKVNQFITQRGYDYPILLDKDRKVASTYQTTTIPTTYFLNPQGEIEYIKRGLLTKPELEKIADKLTNSPGQN